jgi:hypothetical protein
MTPGSNDRLYGFLSNKVPVFAWREKNTSAYNEEYSQPKKTTLAREI